MDETRKIEIGRSNLPRVLCDKWDKYAASLGSPTWFVFCVFLVDQIPSDGVEDFKHSDIYQWDNQSVCTFALELLRRTQGNSNAAHNRLRHLWDRVDPEIRSGALYNW